MVNFGPLAAEIGLPVWGTPANFNGFRVLRYWTMSTIKDEKSAAKFHYIKTVSGKVVAQSIAFRLVLIYWQRVAPFA